jgi:hypothetical protein
MPARIGALGIGFLFLGNNMAMRLQLVIVVFDHV